MSVRKRTWTTGKGVEKSAWVVDYVDTKGKRRLKSFRLKKEADQFAATATIEVREGVHVADSDSATVATAGKLWLASASASGLEGANWTEVARIVLHRDPASDVARTRRCWESHLARAKWMTKTGYRRLLEKAVEEQNNALH